MRLSTSQGFSTPLLYTARMAARSVGAITSKSSTNSISLIQTLAVSDGTATLPYPSIVIVVRFILCAVYMVKRPFTLLSKADMSFSSFLFVTCRLGKQRLSALQR